MRPKVSTAAATLVSALVWTEYWPVPQLCGAGAIDVDASRHFGKVVRDPGSRTRQRWRVQCHAMNR